MQPAPVPVVTATEAPLPAEIAGATHGWLTGYRRYPVFSRPWARGRAASLGVVVLAVTALLLGVALLGSTAGVPWGGFAQIVLTVVVPLFAGPWLGSLVRARRLPPTREGWALVAVVAGVVAAVVAFNEWGAEPLKQTVAEWTGHVDESGRRKLVAVSIGVEIRAADEPGPAPSTQLGRDPTRPTTATHLFGSFLAFCLAGGFALPRWRREQAGLEALARARELAQAQAARREAEMRLSVLAAQVEPHFLFNTLAGVRSAIATDPARAATLVDRLVDYLRAAIPRLRSDGEVEATVAAQFDLVRAYLGLMAARMPRLAFALTLPDELRDAHCPPLMLISLAENAVKHGIEPKIGPARVEVGAARADDGRLVLTVADDGVGFGEGTAGSGLGLTNIRERLAQLYPGRAELVLRARPEGGVAASLVLPLEFAPPAAA